MNRKTYGSIPAKEGYFNVTDYRQLIDYRMETAPEVPIFSYLNYNTNEKTTVLPAQFKSDSEAVCVFLAEEGWHRKRIVLLGTNSYEYMLALQGILTSGNIAVPLDQSLDVDYLVNLTADCEAEALFYSANREEKARAIAEKLPVRLYCIDGIPEFVQAGKKLIGAGRTEGLTRPLDADAEAFIVYTSGTTGRSKGVMLSQKNVILNLVGAARTVTVDMDQVHMMPMNHLYGMGTAILAGIITGHTLHLNTNLRYLMKDIAAGKPEMIVTVPMVAENLLGGLWKYIRANGREEAVRAMIGENRRKGNVSEEEKRRMFRQDLAALGGRLRLMVSGGAPMPLELYEGYEAFGIRLREGYGITECAPVLSVNTDDLYKIGSVGRIVEGGELMIDNPNEDGIGEICAKGPFVMSGYYNMKQETEDAMRGGWFHTGDLGYLDEDDFVFITGRIKNLIILPNGENVSPEELEQWIEVGPGIQEVVVYDKDGAIAAMVYPNPDLVQEKGLEQVCSGIREFIFTNSKKYPAYKRVTVVEFRSTPFERTALKKIKRTSIHEGA